MGFGTHFFDSGAFTLEKMARKFAKETGRSKWDFFRTKEAKQFLDDYAAFVKEHETGIDYYANVDAIGNPELTWRNQQYLESLGLSPIPVVHFGTDVKWLSHYIDKGYQYIALGGLVGRKNTRKWIDNCFSVICGDDGFPSVRVHGFGVASLSVIRRYPWFSVDSTAWIKPSCFGNIFVPKRRQGKWDYDRQPFLITVSGRSNGDRVGDDHIMTCSSAVRDIVTDWMKHICVDLEKSCDDCVGYKHRIIANVRFFHEFVAHLPKWPWQWKRSWYGFGVL